jgi:hypothetical protein
MKMFFFTNIMPENEYKLCKEGKLYDQYKEKPTPTIFIIFAICTFFLFGYNKISSILTFTHTHTHSHIIIYNMPRTWKKVSFNFSHTHACVRMYEWNGYKFSPANIYIQFLGCLRLFVWRVGLCLV